MTMAASDWKKWLAVGAGIGIEIGERDLRVTVARVRPGSARILGSAVIAGFRERAAAEWGKVYNDFVRHSGAGHLSATVLLPRRDVILRTLALPNLSRADMASAIRLQIDSLHPFPEEEAAWVWARLNSQGAVLVAIARRDTLSRYVELFSEAGIRSSAFTVSAPALYSAMRLLATPPESFVALGAAEGELEIYGESPAKPVFSAAFDLPPERAASLAAADLRLDRGVEPVELASLLPRPSSAPADYDLSRNALPYAAALAAACPRLALPVNLLPPENRISHSRLRYVPTAALLVLLAGSLAALASITPIEDRRYMAALQSEIRNLAPQAARAAELDKAIEAVRSRSRTIDSFRQRSKADLDALAELTRLLPESTSLASLELTRQFAILAGTSEQAAPLLHTIDDSPLFSGSKFTIPLVRSGTGEQFRIQAEREEGAR